MDKLWAPWRIPYIKGIKHKKRGCLFCKAARAGVDPAHMVFLKMPHALAMLNIYPYNNGHVMVAPVRHVRSLELLSEKELSGVMACVKKTMSLLKGVLKPEGYNIGMNIGRVAGAGIADHMHIHIVPRWHGDTNFMSTLASTRVISQSLTALYEELAKENRRRR